MRRLAFILIVAAPPAFAAPVNTYGASSIPPNLDRIIAKTPDKVICMSDDVTGSRLETVKICHSATEWAEVRRKEQAMLPFQRLQAAKCPDPKFCARGM